MAGSAGTTLTSTGLGARAAATLALSAPRSTPGSVASTASHASPAPSHRSLAIAAGASSGPRKLDRGGVEDAGAGHCGQDEGMACGLRHPLLTFARSMASRMKRLASSASPQPSNFTHLPGSRSL